MSTTWQTKKLGDICEITTGSSNTVDAVDDGQYAFFDRSKIIKRSNKFLFDSEALIIPGEGAEFFPRYYLGKFNLHQRAYALLNFDKDVFIKFVEYYLILEHKYFERVAVGATAKSLRRRHFVDLEIPLPPLPDQHRIVKIIDDVFAAAEKAKENAEKNLENSRELFEGYLDSVFESPKIGWEEKRIKEIGETQTGLTPKTSNNKYYGDFAPFITPADVDFSGDGSVRYDIRGLSEEGLNIGRKIKKDSILMVCIGATIGKVGFVTQTVSCNQQINTLTPSKKWEAKIFYYALSTKSFYDKIIKNSSQATLPIINKGKWENLTVYFPPQVSEQKLIVAKLDDLSTQTKKLEEIYRQKLALLEELKKSVLHKAFANEL